MSAHHVAEHVLDAPLAHPQEAADPSEPGVAALLEASEAYARSLYPDEGVYMIDVSELMSPAVRFRVVRSDVGVVEGCGAIVLQHEGTVELKRMFVRGPARRHGVGAFILESLEREARAEGATIMRLETGPLQTAAIELYSECGPFGGYLPSPYSVFMMKTLR